MGSRRHRKKAAAAAAAIARLPVDMLVNIHGCLSHLDRLAFAAVFRTSREAFKPEAQAPCLLHPGDAPGTIMLFSLAERSAAAVRAPGLDHAILGSSCCGWLVTADDRARLCLVNPVTGERCALPAIDTISCLDAHCGRSYFTFPKMWFLTGPAPYPYRTMTLRAEQMRQFLYLKVVLSDSAAIAMLITGPDYGVVAFAMAGGGGWRLALPPDGVEPVTTAEAGTWRLRHWRNGIEDAVYHEGRFYSITYSGQMEAWEERDANTPGVFASAVIAPRLPLPIDSDHRKYLMSAPGGRLMVVVKEGTGLQNLPSFKVQILDAGRGEWKVTDDIDEASLFVGGNGSLCVSTRKHPELRAGWVYYTEHGEDARDRYYSGFWMFSLKDGSRKKVEGLGRYRNWPPPTWYTPAIP